MATLSNLSYGGVSYEIKDAAARSAIDALQKYTNYLGVTTTELTDGASTNPITINGDSVTAKKGEIANYGSKEFIFNGSVWQEFGDLSGLGSLAFKDSASGTATVAAQNVTVSSQTITIPGQNVTVSANATVSGASKKEAKHVMETDSNQPGNFITSVTYDSSTETLSFLTRNFATATLYTFNDSNEVTVGVTGNASVASQSVDTIGKYKSDKKSAR